MASREDFEFDIENSGNCSEEDTDKDSETAKGEAKSIWCEIWSRLISVDGSLKHECGIASTSNCEKSGGKVMTDENIELLIESNLGGDRGGDVTAGLKKKSVKEKHNKNRKTSKPPRPPKGPSLDAADQILVKEITELAMKKRARVERMKALKKMKAEKPSSFSNSLPALVITFLFCVVIIFQVLVPVISSRSSAILHGSPKPAVDGSRGFITIQYFNNFSTYEMDGPGYNSPHFVAEQASGSVPLESLEAVNNH